MFHCFHCSPSSLLIRAFAGTCLLLSAGDSAGAQEGISKCDRRVAGVGFPRPSQQLAELSAISKWLEAAAELSVAMPAWHRAQGKSMKCEEIGTLGRISCTVIARPCFEVERAETADPAGSVR